MEKMTITQKCDGCEKVVSYDQETDLQFKWRTDAKSHEAKMQACSWRQVAAVSGDTPASQDTIVRGNVCSIACEMTALIKLLTAAIERDKNSTL